MDESMRQTLQTLQCLVSSVDTLHKMIWAAYVAGAGAVAWLLLQANGLRKDAAEQGAGLRAELGRQYDSLAKAVEPLQKIIAELDRDRERKVKELAEQVARIEELERLNREQAEQVERLTEDLKARERKLRPPGPGEVVIPELESLGSLANSLKAQKDMLHELGSSTRAQYIAATPETLLPPETAGRALMMFSEALRLYEKSPTARVLDMLGENPTKPDESEAPPNG